MANPNTGVVSDYRVGPSARAVLITEIVLIIKLIQMLSWLVPNAEFVIIIKFVPSARAVLITYWGCSNYILGLF